jgi:xanthine dehydrogenase accessory factor
MFDIQKLVGFLRRQDTVALATLVDLRGGSSKRLGARAVWLREGRLVGSLTAGGCVDAEASSTAPRVVESGNPEVIRVELGEDELDFGMSCAGTATVFVEPIEPIRENLLAVLEKVRIENAAGRSASVVLRLDENKNRYSVVTRGETLSSLSEYLVAADYSDGDFSGAQLVHGDECDIFVESFSRPPRLVVVGASPIADPLVRLAKMVGFEVVVVTSQAVENDRFSVADSVHCGMPSEICSTLRLDSDSFVVITAHDYKYEVPVLRDLASKRLAYLGFVASRRRGKAVLKFLSTTGSDLDEIAEIHVPVGLDIGAVTPEEIAVSVTAELLAARNRKEGGSMRESAVLPRPAAERI